MAAWIKLASFEEPGFRMPPVILNAQPQSEKVDGRDPTSGPTIFQGAVEGQVLVKNSNNALPLSAPRALSTFGYDAGMPPKNDPALNVAWYLLQLHQ